MMRIDTEPIDQQHLRIGLRPGPRGAATPPLILNGIGANLELLVPFVRALDSIPAITFERCLGTSDWQFDLHSSIFAAEIYRRFFRGVYANDSKRVQDHNIRYI